MSRVMHRNVIAATVLSVTTALPRRSLDHPVSGVPARPATADIWGMRRRSLATTFVALTVGLAARAALRRLAARRAAAVTAAAPVAPPAAAPVAPAVSALDAVVLPFVRRVVVPAAAAPEQPAAPARCGDSGGRTKAGAACAARAGAGGRCHHHRLAA
jgi:hypothetical protein